MADTLTHSAAPSAGDFSRGRLVLADGTVFEGQSFGADTVGIGEVCFNTAMTGYQEILTDPSYAGQIVCFTFPHIGIVGTNAEDIETLTPVVRGLIVRVDAEQPSNYRAILALDGWLKRHGIPALAGIDTRALTNKIRERGMPHGAITRGDIASGLAAAKSFSGLVGLDLAKEVTSKQIYRWSETPWAWSKGYGEEKAPDWRVTVIDFGVKRNILRMLAGLGADITVVPAQATFDEVLQHKPDGVLLSNGPGDPAATGEYAIPTIKGLVDSNVPVFGICLGHQMLGLALGGETRKMPQGHHGANHPVKDLETGKVEIVSMNHGFTVDADTLPKGVIQTHVSLFDGTNCGLRVDGKKVFSVQYHPEASPGPMDSHYLFDRFARAARGGK
ncbi:MAG: glutamine-hydrolyzing carbamoyl-phosphate synthase small subunit [Alphaproteobacteria bacterium]|nr:glutamine-hydrolyzing carbamoyl-phosphate synthase small subunit [Alphaproteobacteria bacterium]MBL6937435.1 glutamine-hydrolyzing carbamoyl-phosphate synthase small subunit [Alphaproteobacteria bacterium]MBL7098773.1 glutamine-hydrolyzing carbamoyl-phosphate synthase small subunit [Alphaproteobacteria bacterium]